LCAEIKEGNLAALKRTRPWISMWERGICASKSGHIKGECLGTTLSHFALQEPRHLRLGCAREDLRQDGGKRAIRHCAGSGDPLDLRWLLYGAEGNPPTFRRRQGESGGSLSHALPDRVTDRAWVNPEVSYSVGLRPRRDRRTWVTPWIERGGERRFTARLHRVPRICEDRERVRGDEDPATYASGRLLIWTETDARKVARIRV
jgi:hypothetical protein